MNKLKLLLVMITVVLLAGCQQTTWIKTNEYKAYDNVVVVAHDKTVYAKPTEEIKEMWISSSGQIKLKYVNGQTMTFSGNYTMTYYNND